MARKRSSATMSDVAREAGVALGTVSKVINGIPVGESYRIRVEEAVAKLNYRVNSYAKGLKSNKTYTIAVLVPNLLSPFFSKLVNYINKSLAERKYRMIFLGSQQEVLDSLKKNLIEWNEQIADMKFVELPFCNIDEFDYASIGRMVNEDKADIIWVALGAPKQEFFMHRLQPHLDRGVMIAVGAAFKFYSDLAEKRAPEWMVKNHLEFMNRIWQDPRKQVKRCYHIMKSLPRILVTEIKKK